MKTFRKYATIAATLAAVAVASAPAAQAQLDAKNYPGASCVKWNAAQPTPSLNWSRIWNPSAAAAMSVDCVAVKDGGNVAAGWVRVIDQHPAQGVSCRLASTFSASEAGVIANLSAVATSIGNNPNVQQLNFGALGGFPVGHLYYSCSVPPTFGGNRSWIATYQVREVGAF